MSNTPINHDETEMISEYDLSGKQAVRGKYYQRVRHGYSIQIQHADGTTTHQASITNESTITLDADVREYFPDAESVNNALRGLIQLIPKSKSPAVSHE